MRDAATLRTRMRSAPVQTTTGVIDLATPRQPERHEVVTDVLGTFCYPCLRVGQLKNGAARGIRTPDPVITNDVLYRLSYCGGPCGKNACHLISGAGRIGKENADPGAGHSVFERSGYRFA